MSELRLRLSLSKTNRADSTELRTLDRWVLTRNSTTPVERRSARSNGLEDRQSRPTV